MFQKSGFALLSDPDHHGFWLFGTAIAQNEQWHHNIDLSFEEDAFASLGAARFIGLADGDHAGFAPWNDVAQ